VEGCNAQSAPKQGDPIENAKRARDNGAIGMYLHGGVSDGLIKKGNVEEIRRIVEGIRKTGLWPALGLTCGPLRARAPKPDWIPISTC
jgi:hypothetical protein